MQMPVESPTEKRIVYPEAQRTGQVDDYHGTKVADPYRWLEDANSAADRRPGSTAENKVTRPTSTPSRSARRSASA